MYLPPYVITADQKLKTFTLGIREQSKGTAKRRKPQRLQLKMDLLTRKKKSKIILIEAFRLKLSKLQQYSS